MIARSFICCATPGRCSLIWMPDTAVSIAFDGPPFGCPTFKSNVSVCVGPPAIHSKMNAFGLVPASAASAA